MRWALYIQHQDLEIQYIAGKENIIADLFSRTIYGDETINKEINYDTLVASILAKNPSMEIIVKLKNIAILQDQDPKLSKIKSLIKNKTKVRKGFEINYNILYKDNKIVIPKSLINLLVEEIHEIYGHIGSYKCFRIFNESFTYNKAIRKISRILKCCDSCQRNKYYQFSTETPPQAIIASRPNELLAIDFIGPFPTSTGGVKYILTTIDAFSKFVVLYPIKKHNGNVVISKLKNDYFEKYGKPERILFDNKTVKSRLRSGAFWGWKSTPGTS